MLGLGTLQRVTRAAVFLAGTTAAGCRADATPPARVTVAPGSSAHALDLRVASPLPVSSLRVARSRLASRYPGSPGRTYWFLAPAAGAAAAPLPAVVRYGEAPTGFTGSTPVTLTPGRYEVEVVAGGRHTLSYFRIEVDGAAASGDSRSSDHDAARHVMRSSGRES